MTLEQRYAALVVALFATVIGGLWLLVQLYASELMSLLLARCPGSLGFMFGSWSQVGALIILALSTGLITFMVTRFVLSFLKTWQLQQQSLLRACSVIPRKLQKICHAYHLPTTQLVVVKGGGSVYTIGVFQPKIVISQEVIKKLSPPHLAAVMLHERYHQQRSHAAYQLAAEIVVMLFWWLPVVAEVVSWMKTRFEQAADRFAAEQQGTPRHVVAALCVLAGQPIPSFALGFSRSAISDRIAALYGRPQIQPLCTLRSILLSICSLLAVGAICVLPAVMPNQALATTDLHLSVQRSEAGIMCGEVMSRQLQLTSQIRSSVR